jgi:protein TonB
MSTMSKSADLLDLVFRGRNKAYGAYDLRRVYPTHIKRSMIIFLFIVIAIAGGYGLYNYLKENVNFETEKPVRAVTELKAPPPLEDKKNPPPPPPPPPPPIKATIQFVPPKVVEIARPEEEIKTVEEVVESKAQVANETVVGQELPEEIELGNGGPVEAPKSNEPFAFVEQMPEFPGGEDALIRYLQKNIRYPNYAAENEIEGTVQVEFIVNEDGSIQNTKVVKGIKGGCDEEALRVVKSMPRWKPGKQGGHAVRVYYTVPVTFRLE